MPKKHTKQDFGKFTADMIKAKQDGVKFKPGRKDGSIATKPFINGRDLPEADVLKACISWLKIRCIGAKRINNGAGDFGGGFRYYGIKGAGDILCCHGGQYIEVECKAGRGGRLSKTQQKHRDWVEFHGGFYFVVHGVGELEHFFNQEIFNKDAK